MIGELRSSYLARHTHLQFNCKSIAICIQRVYHGVTMIIPRHNVRFRRWMTGLLLAAYGSAGVFGYGLHAVWECEHHCHVHSHGDDVAHVHHHGHGCHHHNHEPVVANRDNPATFELTVDDCPICDFLVQAQTPIVLESTSACIGPTSPILILLDSSYVAPLTGGHSARGPPLG